MTYKEALNKLRVLQEERSARTSADKDYTVEIKHLDGSYFKLEYTIVKQEENFFFFFPEHHEYMLYDKEDLEYIKVNGEYLLNIVQGI